MGTGQEPERSIEMTVTISKYIVKTRFGYKTHLPDVYSDLDTDAEAWDDEESAGAIAREEENGEVLAVDYEGEDDDEVEELVDEDEDEEDEDEEVTPAVEHAFEKMVAAFRKLMAAQQKADKN